MGRIATRRTTGERHLILNNLHHLANVSRVITRSVEVDRLLLAVLAAVLLVGAAFDLEVRRLAGQNDE